MNVTTLLQTAVTNYRSPDSNGSNGSLGLSKLMGISNGSLSRKVSPNDPVSHCSPEEVVFICKTTGDMAPFLAMAAALGCVVLPMSVDRAADVSPTLATNFKEDGEWLQAASTAYAAPVLSDNLLAQVTREGIESMSATAATLMQLQAKHDAATNAPSKPALRVA
jgi:hypothetical protein